MMIAMMIAIMIATTMYYDAEIIRSVVGLVKDPRRNKIGIFQNCMALK